ncbi:hypothetical protein [Pseudomonas sp. LP_7_YM]|uniref:hypothetical protein n=1 Tax=Pseudomonas sp. LP_7_YM TaxID=2485137 RepID=UPI00105F2BF4|nr:hypothetical protein [Pseudomonas sp. LP_7_YM]
MTVEAFTTRHHVYPTPWVSNAYLVDRWLARQGTERHIAACADTYGSALQLLRGTDRFLTLPRRILAALAPRRG